MLKSREKKIAGNVMKKDEIIFSTKQTSEKLGISSDVLLRELRDGKIKGNWRGKRIKFTQTDIDEYKRNQVIDNSEESEPYVFKHLKIDDVNL